MALFAGVPQANALDSCLYSSCTPRERLLGTGLRRPDPYRSPNDLYNERNQDRYKSGIKAKPFDVGSPVDTTRSLNGNTTGKAGSASTFATSNNRVDTLHLRKL